MVIPLQYAVVTGVGLSILLYVVRKSNALTLRRRVRDADGQVREVDVPAELHAGEIVTIQPYGSLFFAAAAAFEEALPAVTADSRGSVVIVRLRGRTELGSTFTDVLARYAATLAAADSKLMLVSTSERIDEQLAATGLLASLGRENVYRGDERVGAALAQAEADAAAWVAARAG